MSLCHFVEKSLVLHQFLKRTFLDYAPLVENDDAVAVADGRESVGDDHTRTHQLVEVVADGLLRDVVECRRRLVEVERVIGNWLAMARCGDYKGIMLDTAKRSYSPQYLRRRLPFYTLLGSVGKPRSFARFITQAESCLQHDAYVLLPQITCPTLVLGGTDDQIVTAAASEEIASQVPGSSLCLYKGLGHGLYEESRDFLPRVAAFFS